MENLFVPYQIALGLKEIAFGERCIAYYRIDEVDRTGDMMLNYVSRGKDFNYDELKYSEEHKKYLKASHVCGYVVSKHRFVAVAPTWDQVFEWFREKHNLFGFVAHGVHKSKLLFFPVIWDRENFLWEDIDSTNESHRGVQVILLEKMIEIVKSKTN